MFTWIGSDDDRHLLVFEYSALNRLWIFFNVFFPFFLLFYWTIRFIRIFSRFLFLLYLLGLILFHQTDQSIIPWSYDLTRSLNFSGIANVSSICFLLVYRACLHIVIKYGLADMSVCVYFINDTPTQMSDEWTEQEKNTEIKSIKVHMWTICWTQNIL